MNAEALAQRLNLAKRDGSGWTACCPAHDDRTPSLAFRDGDDGRLLAHCFAGCTFDAIRAAIESLGIETRPERHRQAPVKRHDDRTRIERAKELWNDAGPLEPLARRYFEARGLASPDSPALRWHPACPFGRDRLPCILGEMTDPATGELTGIHRTALTRDGEKIGRKMLGRSGVVRLADDADVTLGLGIAEGLETALAVIQAGWRPIWAALSAGGISGFPVLAGIESLTIFADADDAGMTAADRCARRWADAGREARIVPAPEARTDWADHLGGDHAA